ncbi:hypothetical protein Pedsa_0897 [Pseudopedobacter saltans DSM 12145]|uniref:Uncharacterized protein n=1 Tax=Pseudopedobacter saltans (strain ATCC 51119 / DSM 12145 / JCM 21818 / CCUG 39354 / LMG 10337 / NBRC 100064 / NCIMB 13643) TaxID=762903 RepID=F0SA92_PSESL|nr:hypothetical protein [Pseudopedobacter saltans]ADY51469.1 hypothetical protein Pedsa_0897 [Pseudopedobacter saltans DSM 12145]
MKKQTTIKSLEHQLDGKIMTGDFLIENYKKIPETDLEKRARYQIFLKKHFLAVAELCDQIEERIEEAITILENKKTA